MPTRLDEVDMDNVDITLGHIREFKDPTDGTLGASSFGDLSPDGCYASERSVSTRSGRTAFKSRSGSAGFGQARGIGRRGEASDR